MFSIIIAATLFLSAMSASLPIANSVQSTLISFDDISNSTNSSGFSIPTGYHGLNWTGGAVLDGDTFPNTYAGYKAGVVSHPYVAFDPWAADINFATANETTFTLNSLYSCAVWYDDAVTLEITGSKSGTVVNTKSVLLNTKNKTFIELNWSGLDNVLLHSTCEICCNDKHFTVDNLSVTF